MDGLEHYLARRQRRRRFALTIRDVAEPDMWARLDFNSQVSIATVNGRVIEELSPRDLRLSVKGSGLADVEDSMAGAGWTKPVPGYSDPGSGRQSYSFRRAVPPDDTPATYTAIARGAAAALLGTDRYLLTIEPYQGESELSIGEAAMYAGLRTMAGFVVGAPVAILLVLVTGTPLEVALVAGVLVTIAALYLARGHALDVALIRFLLALSESAIVERPVVGPLIGDALGLAVFLIGVWLPIAVAIVIIAVF